MTAAHRPNQYSQMSQMHGAKPNATQKKASVNKINTICRCLHVVVFAYWGQPLQIDAFSFIIRHYMLLLQHRGARTFEASRPGGFQTLACANLYVKLRTANVTPPQKT